MYGDSRLPTGTVTQIVVNPQQLKALSDAANNSGSGSGSGSGTATGKPPAYFINGATDAIKKLISKKMTKIQINSVLETYRQMIAVETSTPYVPTVLDASITGVSTNSRDGKLEVTTRGAEVPNSTSGINLS
jgi:hypothetical protein